ncbi:hypothetical protein GCM10023160_18850 [Brachybacterium paraconglomeratum]|uniref:GIY-YIG nuclease family protein n=1 Tax=Brachybacterium paraconglomeratum TaxID=173362 RepID=UPI0031E6AABD
MTLHEAMEKVLVDAGRPLKSSELAEQIKTLDLYRKRDGSPLQQDQVRARARKYPHLFAQAAGAIALASWRDWEQVVPAEPSPLSDAPVPRPAAGTDQSPIKSPGLAAALLEPSAFRSAGTIDLEVPVRPGLYAIRVRDRDALPEPFKGHSELRGHDLLYIGVAGQSLNRRLLGQELRAQGHGTLFRSLGALLGYRPRAGSLVDKGNTKNYQFAPDDSQAIIEWINANLLVNWVEFSGAYRVEETALIKTHLPLLNLQGNPAAIPELSALRAECVRIANVPTG